MGGLVLVILVLFLINRDLNRKIRKQQRAFNKYLSDLDKKNERLKNQ